MSPPDMFSTVYAFVAYTLNTRERIPWTKQEKHAMGAKTNAMAQSVNFEHSIKFGISSTYCSRFTLQPLPNQYTHLRRSEFNKYLDFAHSARGNVHES